MKFYRIVVPLTEEEKAALLRLSEHERRDQRAQAAILIRQQLIALGYLKPLKPPFSQQEEN